MDKQALKQELFNYSQYKSMIEVIGSKINAIKNDYQGVKGISFDNYGGGGTNQITRTVENEVIKKEQRINQLERERAELTHYVDRIDSAMTALSENERKIIQERFFNKQDFYTVSAIMGLSYGHVKRVCSGAVNVLHMVLGD